MTRWLVLALVGGASTAHAQPASLECPQVSSDTMFAGETMESECSAAITTGCTTKTGVTYDPLAEVLELPATAGHFQAPPGAAVDENVLFAAIGDFDRDGWEDIAGADDFDKIFVLRNQTITCGVSPAGSTNGTSTCSGSSTSAPTDRQSTISAAWWNTLTNKRAAAFRFATTTGGTLRPLKPSPSGTSNPWTPMVAGDFDGDGWTDIAALSYTYATGGFPQPRYATAARLYLNTRNCKDASNVPCGVGMTCAGQPAHGACTGSGLSAGTPHAATELSCTTTRRCPYFHPTFASYDLRTGAAVSANNRWTNRPSTPTATTYKPGDFGPLSRPTTNMTVLDWEGDGDLDILYGHGASGNGSSQRCPSALCETGGRQFFVGLQVWRSSCAQSPQWNPLTRSCVGHVPRFSHEVGSCTSTSCDNPDTLFPSSAHNTPPLEPRLDAGFDHTNHKVPVFAYADIDNDHDRDLVIGSVGCCSNATGSVYKLRIYRNTSGSMSTHTLDTSDPIVMSTRSNTYPGFEGALTAVFVHDFSGDGWPDLITATDALSYNSSIGGRTRYWKNTGNASSPFGTAWPTCSSNPATCADCDATCNPNPTAFLSQSCGSSSCNASPTAAPYPRFPDFDNGLMIDYDHDPTRTKDLVLTNGATSAEREFYVFPNRASKATVPACGVALSGTLPEPSGEATVSGACITPDATLANTTSSIRWYLSNEAPANYVLACTQTSSGTDPDPCCVAFTNLTGKTITWKAELDSSTADDANPTKCTIAGEASPTISRVAANYTYTEAQEHYRAGVVVSDGVAYVGSFEEPGDRGHFYGLAAGDGTAYFDAATKLDAQGARKVYTADGTGTNLSPIRFSTTAISPALQARVAASTTAEASSIIGWVLSARFGIGARSRLGAVMSSTPAILTPPFRPAYYAYLSASEKARYDTFAATHASRTTLALFASMDGMIHAIISIATDITNAANGTEAWAFVPPYVAANMKADHVATTTSGALTVTSFPDGSPTLVDFKKADGSIATAAIIGDGAGGSSITALDVTNTVDGALAVTPPDPLWSHQPGDAAAGKAIAKPAVARVRLDTTGDEAFVVVAGTGLSSADPTKGKVVAGYDLETGRLLWRFELECALTSDITVFETDDEGEAGDPTLDGFTDRAVFADSCGYLYELAPGTDLGGGWLDNVGHGSIVLATSNGAGRRALFSTTQTGALGAGEQRPIVGTIAATSDLSTDVVLMFGTGGLESFAATEVNELYAVRAKDGTIRGKVTGSCAAGRCEKFYGGVVVTPDRVIVQRSRDPVIDGTGSCDYGASRVQFLDLQTLTQTEVIDQIAGAPIAASAGPLYGDAGAIYFATVAGEIQRIGQPRAEVAGADTAGGTMQSSTSGGGGGVGGASAMSLIGWRVVL